MILLLHEFDQADQQLDDLSYIVRHDFIVADLCENSVWLNLVVLYPGIATLQVLSDKYWLIKIKNQSFQFVIRACSNSQQFRLSIGAEEKQFHLSYSFITCTSLFRVSPYLDFAQNSFFFSLEVGRIYVHYL